MATDHVSPASHGCAAEESNPSWMLLELCAYLENVKNATTAISKTSDNKHIQLTFCPRPPPHLSRFCVHSPDGAYIHGKPHVVAVEDDLALLRVDVGGCAMNLDYYVYQAGGGDDGSGTTPPPSLTLLPRTPRGLFFHPKDIGMLRPGGAGGKEYIVAGFRFLPSAHSQSQGGFTLCLYDSRRGDWKAYALSLSPQARQGYGDKMSSHKNSKVLTIGGDAGTMAFVDLWRGVLFCDVLQVESRAARQAQHEAIPLLEYVSMPDDLARNAKIDGDARLYRDIAFLDGHLKCVDLSSRSLWMRPATTTSSISGGWSQKYSIESFRAISDRNPGTNLLPGHKEGLCLRSFRHLFVCQPVVGLEDDDARVLYFTLKMHTTDDHASVVAVDMVSKEILGVAPFFSRYEIINYTYMHSRLSKHLKSIAPGAQAILKQPGMMSQGCSSRMQDEAQEQHSDEFVAEDGDAMALD